MKNRLLLALFLLVVFVGIGTWVLRGPLSPPAPHTPVPVAVGKPSLPAGHSPEGAAPQVIAPSPPPEAVLPVPVDPPTERVASAAPPTTDANNPPPAPPVRRTGPLRIPAGAPIPELFPNQELRDDIIRLASTYDVAQIPTIARYLQHKEETVRDTARIGLIQIGDAKAVPYLQTAALKARTPEEATALREAAEFLGLPNSSEAPPPTPSADDSPASALPESSGDGSDK